MTHRNLMQRARRPAALVGALAATAVTAGLIVGATLAEVPDGPPVFSNPTLFTNEFMPFEVGAVKAYVGKSEGERTAVVDLFLATTRDFALDGEVVTCRVLQETEFEGGELSEISTNYFACADDGTVYYFGEVVDIYEDGEVVGADGSWLVGGGGPGDPDGTLSVDEPALFMPGDPEVGDFFRPENVPGGPMETAEIEKEDRRVRVTAGRYEGCIQVRETNVADDESERKWYAPGVGVIKAKGKQEILKLIASTLLPTEDE